MFASKVHCLHNRPIKTPVGEAHMKMENRTDVILQNLSLKLMSREVYGIPLFQVTNIHIEYGTVITFNFYLSYLIKVRYTCAYT